MWNPFKFKKKEFFLACSYCGGKVPKSESVYQWKDFIYCSLSCVLNAEANGGKK
jgi:hypothetical protein